MGTRGWRWRRVIYVSHADNYAQRHKRFLDFGDFSFKPSSIEVCARASTRLRPDNIAALRYFLIGFVKKQSRKLFDQTGGHFAVPTAMFRITIKNCVGPQLSSKSSCPARTTSSSCAHEESEEESQPAATAVDTYIGTQMRNGRTALGLSQEVLGEKLGVSFQQIQKYEKGINRVSAARLFEICKTLKIPLARMFESDPAA
jgi:DNA-binding transcriptional regulator YiaG